MRGRDVFARYKGPLAVASICFMVLPRRLREACFVLGRRTPFVIGIGLRYILMKTLAKACGECVLIAENSYVLNPAGLELGDNVSIHSMCYVDAAGGIKIGSNVSIAHGTSIMSTNHQYMTDGYIRDAKVLLAPVEIDEDVWIGAGVRILAGVKIGRRVVVAAGAVVTKDVPPHSIVAGVPAKQIKTI